MPLKNKILVVEDEPDIMLVVTERLKIAGYDVTAATNGKEGLAAINNSLPDLIITDVIMPELDGYGMLKELKKNPTTAKIPAIVLTARNKMGDSFATIGVNDFLAKPFNDKVLLDIIKKLLDTPNAYTPPPTPQPPVSTNPVTTTTLKSILSIICTENSVLPISQFFKNKSYALEILMETKQVIAKVKQLQPVLILIEIPLQNGSVNDIIKGIQAIPQSKKTPILLYSTQVLLSNNSSQNSWQNSLNIEKLKDEYLGVGASAYLGNCLDANALMAINKYL